MAKFSDMDLAAYLSEHKIRPAAFAATIGVPASTITRILRGERDPRGTTIRKIVEGTGGAVTAADLLRARACSGVQKLSTTMAEAAP